MNPLRTEIFRDLRALVQEEATGERRVLRLSREVAELLDAIQEPSITSGSLTALASLEAEVAECTKCTLCKSRTNTVFSDGNTLAGIVFVGEAPGRDEDLQGKPFVGRAGQLLTDIIVKGMKLERGDVYICNILKCRPPNNRDPHPGEVEQCEPYLVRQLELVRPKVICCLGRIAAQTLLKTTESLGRLRGRWHFYHGIPLRVTFHPAYILRQEGDELREAKMKTWDDVKEVLKVYHGELTPQ